jgi:hypothetical protein
MQQAGSLNYANVQPLSSICTEGSGIVIAAKV